MVARIKRQIDPAFLPAAAGKEEKPVETHSPSLAIQIFQKSGSYLSATMKAAIDLGQYGVSRLADFSVGLPMAEAAKPEKKDDSRLSVDQFIKELGNAFDIRKSLLLNAGQSLKGVTVIIGEDHYDHAVQDQIKQLIRHYLRADQNDMLVMEGDEITCEHRAALYNLPERSCVSIEENSKVYIDIKNELISYEIALAEVGKFIHQINPQLPWEQVERNQKGYLEFIERYTGTLPAEAIPKYNNMAKKVLQLNKIVAISMDASIGEREENMLNKIKDATHPDATRFFIIGAGHVQNLAPTLLRLSNVIFMVPRFLIDAGKTTRLPDPERDDL